MIVVVGLGYRDDGELGLVDGVFLESFVPHLLVHGARVECSGGNELDRLVVRSGESGRPLEVGLADAGFLEVVLRHQAPGCGRLATKREGVALQVSERLDARSLVRDEHASKALVDVPLQDGQSVRHLHASLHAGQAAEPDEVQVTNAESGDDSLVVGDRLVLDFDLQRGLQVGREQPVKTVELFGILIGNCREH